VKPEIVTSTPLNIVGIAVRTTNEEGKSAEDIGKLWHQFFTQNISALVASPINPEILYAVYTDYDDKAKSSNALEGHYTTVLGVQAPYIADLPPGFVQITIPVMKCAKFHLHGPVPEVVVELWGLIWSGYFDFKRSFTTDFQIHHPGTPEQGEVDVLIAVE
jgi:predicted transcriptional regulator YdeE